MGITMNTVNSEAAYSTPLVALDAAVIDLETTGLDARSARAVQIGIVRISQGRIVEDEKINVLVNPGMSIPPSATAIHGICDADVKNAPPFSEIISKIEEFVGDAVVLGHTVGYDLSIMKREYLLANREWRQPRALDVRALARLAAPGLANHNIETLCDWLKVPLVGRHTAMGDAETTARLFLALVPKLRERGIRTFAEAEAAIRQLAEADARAAGGLITEEFSTSQSPHIARIDSFPYCHRVRDVMTTPPIFADGGMTVREGVRLLLEKKISSVYIREQSGELGIVTERDVLRAINELGEKGLDAPLASIMSKPLQSVPEDAFVYRAIGRLDRLGFRHLAVDDGRGKIVGALTSRNLLRHRARAAIMLGDEVASAPDVPALAAAWAKLPVMARSLAAEGTDPRDISAVISSEIRDITSRAAQLAEKRLADDGLGPPPCRYAVLVLGSAGRGESLLAADQDNAIVYETGTEGGPEDRWFEALGTQMCRILDEVGVPFCKGGVMAKNRAWRMSLADWKSTIDHWVRRQRPEDLLSTDIFFDGMPVHGDISLGEAIWHYAYDRGHAEPAFQKLLVEVARQRSPAFTLFGKIRIDEKGRIDLKKAGLMPIFTCARVLAIRHDVRARSTPERLRGIAALGVGSEQEIEEVIDAHRTILGAMLTQQIADSENGARLSSRVNPDRLGKAGKRQLAKALEKVDIIIDLVSEGRF
ncbi:MAG: DNA polymerase III subunit epsilon [Proteobacteria bacterium]|nr:MAG: DNA polymerase III subunit epsilon [Pseudomonadota bacterium]